jgi:hypothetical protein
MKLGKGDHVRVRRDPGDDWCEGYVVVISENGKSVGLLLSGMVRAGNGLIGGCLPLVVDEKTQTTTGLTGDEYELEVLEKQ